MADLPERPPQCRPQADAGELSEHGHAWSVYLLACRGDRIYTGIARDVQARLAMHQSGKGARFTRAHPPERLLAVCGCADRSSALRVEAAVKRLSAPAKRAIANGIRDWPAPQSELEDRPPR